MAMLTIKRMYTYLQKHATEKWFTQYQYCIVLQELKNSFIILNLWLLLVHTSGATVRMVASWRHPR